MSKKLFIISQLLPLVLALVCIACMAKPCLSVIIESEKDEDAPFLEVVSDLLVKHEDLENGEHEGEFFYLVGLGNEYASSSWQNLTFFELTRYMWDTTLYFFDNISLSQGVNMLFSAIGALLCASLMLFAIILVIGTLIIRPIRIIACIASQSYADKIESKMSKGTMFGGGMALMIGYISILVSHHFFFGYQIPTLLKYDGGISGIHISMVFSDGIHWMLVMVAYIVLFLVVGTILTALKKSE